MSLSSIVDVQISRQTTAPTKQGFGIGLFLADTVPVAFTERVRIYTDVSDMLTDGFVSTDPAYLAASKYFAQEFKPTQYMVGRIDGADASVAASIAAVREINDDWYGLLYESHAKADILAAAAAIEPLTKIYLVSSSDADILTTAIDDVASELQDSAYDRTAIMYSAVADTQYAEAGWMGRQFPQDPGSTTWKNKTLSGITVDTLPPTEKTNASGKNCNTYTEVGGVNITEEGVMASGEFIDVMRGVDWITARIREDVYYVLINEEKVPYTDDGVASILNPIDAVLRQATNNQILAEDPAYVVTAPLVADVSVTDRANRYLPDVTFEGTLAGAIHKVQIRGVVTV